MKNREQRRADARRKTMAPKSADKKKKVLRIIVLTVVAVMALGVILMPFWM